MLSVSEFPAEWGERAMHRANKKKCNLQKAAATFQLETYSTEYKLTDTNREKGRGTGRQLPPLSSVLYRIISKRRYILAAQLLLREKSGT